MIMKQFIYLLFLLSGTLGFSKDIPVRKGQDLFAAVATAKPGDRVVLASASFTVSSLDLLPGVSLIGAGTTKTTIKFTEFRWWKGSLQIGSDTTTPGNQEISGITFDGGRGKGFDGIQIHNRTNVTIKNVVVKYFYNSGIHILGSESQKSENIEIANFEVIESSRENGSGSMGNIMVSGNASNLTIRDGTIVHLTNVVVGTYGDKTSGTGIKVRPYYAGEKEIIGTVSNSKILRVAFKSKPTAPWSGGLAPNIAIEFWRSVADNVEIAGCYFPTSISLEYNASVNGHRTFWVHDNMFDIQMGQAMELATPYSLVERNTFDFRRNKNIWGVIGNYNSDNSINSLQIINNIFILAESNPHIYRTTAKLDGFSFIGNVIQSTKRISVLQLCRPNSNGCTGVDIRGNSFQSGCVGFEFIEGATVVPSGILNCN